MSAHHTHTHTRPDSFHEPTLITLASYLGLLRSRCIQLNTMKEHTELYLQRKQTHQNQDRHQVKSGQFYLYSPYTVSVSKGFTGHMIMGHVIMTPPLAL